MQHRPETLQASAARWKSLYKIEAAGVGGRPLDILGVLVDMPLYEYQCSHCRAEFELLVRGQEELACPHCQSPKLTKLLSVPAAHSTSAAELPVCRPSPAGGCGLPQCGMGMCGME
jgi:putative FmdB family regulatory protein